MNFDYLQIKEEPVDNDLLVLEEKYYQKPVFAFDKKFGNEEYSLPISPPLSNCDTQINEKQSNLLHSSNLNNQSIETSMQNSYEKLEQIKESQTLIEKNETVTSSKVSQTKLREDKEKNLEEVKKRIAEKFGSIKKGSHGVELHVKKNAGTLLKENDLSDSVYKSTNESQNKSIKLLPKLVKKPTDIKIKNINSDNSEFCNNKSMTPKANDSTNSSILVLSKSNSAELTNSNNINSKDKQSSYKALECHQMHTSKDTSSTNSDVDKPKFTADYLRRKKDGVKVSPQPSKSLEKSQKNNELESKQSSSSNQMNQHPASQKSSKMLTIDEASTYKQKDPRISFYIKRITERLSEILNCLIKSSGIYKDKSTNEISKTMDVILKYIKNGIRSYVDNYGLERSYKELIELKKLMHFKTDYRKSEFKIMLKENLKFVSQNNSIKSLAILDDILKIDENSKVVPLKLRFEFSVLHYKAISTTLTKESVDMLQSPNTDAMNLHNSKQPEEVTSNTCIKAEPNAHDILSSLFNDLPRTYEKVDIVDDEVQFICQVPGNTTRETTRILENIKKESQTFECILSNSNKSDAANQTQTQIEDENLQRVINGMCSKIDTFFKTDKVKKQLEDNKRRHDHQYSNHYKTSKPVSKRPRSRNSSYDKRKRSRSRSLSTEKRKRNKNRSSSNSLSGSRSGTRSDQSSSHDRNRNRSRREQSYSRSRHSSSYNQSNHHRNKYECNDQRQHDGHHENRLGRHLLQK